jgi:hypothetical protein
LPGPLLKFVEMGCSRDGIEWAMALSLLCFSHPSGFLSLYSVVDSLVADAFQIIFCIKIYVNNIFFIF